MAFLPYKMTFFESRQFLFFRSDTSPRSFQIQNLRPREQKSEKIFENRIALGRGQPRPARHLRRLAQRLPPDGGPGHQAGRQVLPPDLPEGPLQQQAHCALH